jgi:hypothetical protein
MSKTNATFDWITILIGAAVLCLIASWAYLGYSLILRSDVCMPTHPNADFHARFLACRQANEIGDLLAGFFAPVATLLVGYAVFIQMRELRAQQVELADTRHVFEEQSALMEAQIMEAKRSADLLSQQNAILRSQEEDRAKDRVWEHLRSWSSRLGMMMRSRLYDNGQALIVHMKSGQVVEHNLTYGYPGLPDDTEAALSIMVHLAIKRRNQFNDALKMRAHKEYRSDFIYCRDLTMRTIEACKALGDDSKMMLELLQLEMLVEILNEYLSDG